ncbi:hypothetical protein BCR43DRAFT_493330 [Syncephalastrum racemosum]|uniref:Uncharacterized protein n=1 Tax=Syncephalastrum racemosum TaxID=13706 RepID=A0A1X2HBQ9_SYNRA|nr:hypothetical protein BCR43DRAFT_493330 [Syncephalastrum racemosum]
MYPGRSRISDMWRTGLLLPPSLCFIWITWHNGPQCLEYPYFTARVMYIITVLFCPTYLRHSTRFPAHVS